MDTTTIIIAIATLIATVIGVYYTYKSFKKDKSSSTTISVGFGDVIAGDKVNGDKIAGNKIIHEKVK